jgi:predicted GNAT family acetyltransferase
MTSTVEAEAISREESNSALIAELDRSPSDIQSDFVFDVTNDSERGRWEATLGTEAIGELSYRFVGGRVVLLTTWVDPAYRNRHVATELIGRVLNEIRQTARKITIICPVVGEFIARNQQYADMIDKVHPGSGAYPAHGSAADSSDEHQLAILARDLS